MAICSLLSTRSMRTRPWRCLAVVLLVASFCFLKNNTINASRDGIGGVDSILQNRHEDNRSRQDSVARRISQLNIPSLTGLILGLFPLRYENKGSKPQTYVRRRGHQQHKSLNNNVDEGRIKNKHVLHRFLVDPNEWEDDDDHDLPFHLQDDDATSNSPSGNINENVANEKGSANDNKSKGVIYSDDIQSKESDPLPPPPPPPPPTPVENKNSKGIVEDGINEEEKVNNDIDMANENSNSVNSNSSKEEKISETNKNQSNNKENRANKNNDGPQADTIIDDILRGFSFAAFFCMILLCFHKLCWHTCVRCGIFPDERVLEARWRRLQLKNKRAYFNPHSPPLDPKGLGAWMAIKAKHDKYGGGGVWDSVTDDVERDMDEWDNKSEGDISFDDDGIALMTWEDHGGDVAVYSRCDDGSASTGMELEYGEGDELEDKSHDSRLFDVDGGVGVEKEADKFFKGRSLGNKRGGKLKDLITRGSLPSDSNNGDSEASSENLSTKTDASHTQQKLGDTEKDQKKMSDDAFFDALEPPSGGKDNDSSRSNGLPSSAQDFVKAEQFVNNGHVLLHTGENNQAWKEEDDNDDDTETSDNGIDADDRGYDEDADLLGLRSDSPPPLDLEEIEKTLVQNMEKAQFH